MPLHSVKEMSGMLFPYSSDTPVERKHSRSESVNLKNVKIMIKFKNKKRYIMQIQKGILLSKILVFSIDMLDVNF